MCSIFGASKNKSKFPCLDFSSHSLDGASKLGVTFAIFELCEIINSRIVRQRGESATAAAILSGFLCYTETLSKLARQRVNLTLMSICGKVLEIEVDLICILILPFLESMPTNVK